MKSAVPARETLLGETALRAMALREVVGVLLAIQARATGDSEALLHEVSSRLDHWLDHDLIGALDEKVGVLDCAEYSNLVADIEQIRHEFDSIMRTARITLLRDPHS